MSDSSDWTLQGHSIEGYRMLMQATVTCLSDPTLSDTALYDQAEQLLGVFDDPEFEAYNRPDWLAQSAIFYMRPDKRERFSAKHFFEAMYQTADEWKLDKGHRFVSAAVCACAELLSSNTTGPPADRLAQELSFLAFEIWFVDQFTHLNQTNPDYEAELSEDTKTKVLMRDDCTCFMTGMVDSTHGGIIRKLLAEESGPLEVTPIFHKSISRHEETVLLQNDEGESAGTLFREMRTLDFLKWFCELDNTTAIDLTSPENSLLLEHEARSAFGRFQWTLRPTEITNTYQVHVYFMRYKRFGTAPIAEYVTFPNNVPASGSQSSALPTASPLVEPPSPELLRAHAVFADVFHHSGLGVLHDPNGMWPDDCTPPEVILDELNTMLLPGIRLPGAGVVRKVRSWARTRRADARKKKFRAGVHAEYEDVKA